MAKLLGISPLRRGVAGALAAVLLSACAQNIDRPDLRLTGEAYTFPRSGTVADADLEKFNGIVIGAGMPVLVNVWASWCAPCRAEAPLLARAAQQYQGRVRFLGVVSRDSAEEATEFMKSFGILYPSVIDVTGRISSLVGAKALPTTLVFDANGVLQSRVLGGISEQRIAAQLDEVLSG